MGFYGTNLSTANRVAFLFDLTYRSRVKMDGNAQTDGIAHGRFVLVEYDEPPITGYFDGTHFYTSAHFQTASRITPREDVIYQDLTSIGTSFSFYIWSATELKYKAVTSATSTTYTANYSEDVRAYGRAYDSTVWMKSYDSNLDRWRYVLIAEMNTVVPTFHLAVDAPEYSVSAPYFDRDSTNLDYYLHLLASWGDKIAVVRDSETLKSDEQVTLRDVNWVNTADGQHYTVGPLTSSPARIYYNKAGFSKTTHTKAPSTIANGINFDLAQTGRKYYDGVNNNGVYLNGQVADDLREWYINLPALGDAVCDMYDLMYGWTTSDQHRYTKFATRRADPNSDVTYKSDCLIGGLNLLNDLYGYIAVERNKTLHPDGNYTYNASHSRYLYYDLGTGNNANHTRPAVYWIYKYDPYYTQASFNYVANGTSTISYTDSGNNQLTRNVDTSTAQWTNAYYYSATRQAYCRLNLNIYSLDISQLIYYAIDRWRLVLLDTDYEDSIYGLMLRFNNIMGPELNTHVRDDSIWGVMHQVWDIIEDIGKAVEPNRLLISNNVGYTTVASAVISSSNSGKVIDGSGNLSYVSEHLMHGYAKANAAGTIAVSDTIKAAIGKLEFKADENSSKIESLTNSLNDLSDAFNVEVNNLTKPNPEDESQTVLTLKGKINNITKDNGVISSRIAETRMNLASTTLAAWINAENGTITDETNGSNTVSVAGLLAAIQAQVEAYISDPANKNTILTALGLPTE